MSWFVFLCIFSLWMKGGQGVALLASNKTTFHNATDELIKRPFLSKQFLQNDSGNVNTTGVARTRNKTEIQINITPPIMLEDIVEPVSLTVVFSIPRMPTLTSTNKCKPSEVYHRKTAKCRKTMAVLPPKHITYRATIHGIKYEIKPVLNCTDPHVYHRHEYKVSTNNRSEVIIIATGEDLQPLDYHVNGTATANDSQAIYVCRHNQPTNCSGRWKLIKEGEFKVLGNKSIMLRGSRRLFERSQYMWKTGRSVYVCENDSQVTTVNYCRGSWRILEGDFKVLKNQSIFVNSSKRTYDLPEYVKQNSTIYVCNNMSWLDELTNCSEGKWIEMEEEEFTILDNRSIYVNTSSTLYDQSEYTWINLSLFVCENSNEFISLKARSLVHDDALSIVTAVCMSISIIALVFVLVTYSLFPELRTQPGINLMNLSVSILLSQLLWLFGSGQTDNPIACTVIAVVLHYLFLVSFVWMSIIAFDTWRAFTAKGLRHSLAETKRKRLMHCLRYMAVGWLSVVVYIAICVAIDQSGVLPIKYGSRGMCFISDINAKWYFFATPLGLIIIFNVILYSLTVRAIISTRHQTNRITDQPRKKREFGIYVKIASLMGFTWIFGFASPFGWQAFEYIFVVVNSLQGVYIAFAFALSGKSRKLYCHMVQGKRSPSKQTEEGKQQESGVTLHTILGPSKHGKNSVLITTSGNNGSGV